MEKEANAVGRGMVCLEVCLWMKVLKHCSVWNWLLFWNQCTEKTEPQNLALHVYSCCSKYFCKNQWREPTQQCKFCVIIEQKIIVVTYRFPPCFVRASLFFCRAELQAQCWHERTEGRTEHAAADPCMGKGLRVKMHMCTQIASRASDSHKQNCLRTEISFSDPRKLSCSSSLCELNLEPLLGGQP